MADDDMLATEREHNNYMLERAAALFLKLRRLREATTDPAQRWLIDENVEDVRQGMLVFGRRSVLLDISPHSSGAVH